MKHTSIARPAQIRRENRCLSVETKNGAVNVWFFEKNADVVREITRGEVVASVEHEIVIPHDLYRVLALEAAIVRVQNQIRIDVGKSIVRGGNFPSSDIFCAVQDLPLQIRNVDRIKVDQANRTNARRGQIKRRRRAKPARADAQYASSFQSLLTYRRHFRHN